jgi:hypothetical protein
MAKPTEPPFRRAAPTYFWKPGELRKPSTGNAATDVYRHLPSRAQPSSVPVRRELPAPPKGKRS